MTGAAPIVAPVAPLPFLVLLAAVALVVAATLSAGEEAANRITRTAAHEHDDAGGRRGEVVVRIAEGPSAPSRAATFVRVLGEMTAAVCFTLVLATALDAWWQVLLASIALSAVLVLVVVGLSPRTVGRRRPAAVLGVVGPAMLGLERLFHPVVRVMDSLGERAGRTTSEERDANAENLRDMVDRVSESEQIEDDEREMLQSVFELGRTMVREVMVPRTDMVTIAVEASLRKAINLFVRSGYSRVPVVGETVDDLRGILYLKDVLAHVANRPERVEDGVESVMREAVFVPEMKPVDDLLDEMRAAVVHIAVVFDEYGGIAGLVTVEDIVEELVGELVDEHDRSEDEVVDGGDGTYVVPARLPLDELGDLFDLTIEDDEVDTVGGLLAKALGKVPIPGARAVTHGLSLHALDAGGRRRQIRTVRVAREEPPVEAGDGDDGEDE